MLLYYGEVLGETVIVLLEEDAGFLIGKGSGALLVEDDALSVGENVVVVVSLVKDSHPSYIIWPWIHVAESNASVIGLPEQPASTDSL